MAPFDVDREQWCRTVLAEIKALGPFDLAEIEKPAPLVLAAGSNSAAMLRKTTRRSRSSLQFARAGSTALSLSYMRWCREQLRHAEARPHTLALAEQVRAKQLVLPGDTLELLSRYQTTLDNQLY